MGSLSRLEFAATRLRYCAITLALDPPAISVKPAPHASLIFSLTILLASARAGDPPAASFANRRAMTWFDSNARAKACSQGLLCGFMLKQVSIALWKRKGISEFAEQNENQHNNQHEPNATATVVAGAVKWAAAESTESTEQRNDENDDDYRSERHRRNLLFC